MNHGNTPDVMRAAVAELGVSSVIDDAETLLGPLASLGSVGASIWVFAHPASDFPSVTQALGTNLRGVVISSSPNTSASVLRDYVKRTRDTFPPGGGLTLAGPQLGDPSWPLELADVVRTADAASCYLWPTSDQAPEDAGLAERIAGQAALYGTSRVVIHGTGYMSGSSPGSVTERAQAKYEPRLLLEGFTRGAERTFLPSIVADPGDMSEANRGYALIDNGRKKPVFDTIRNLLQILDDVPTMFEPGTLDYRIDGTPERLRQLLLEKADGRFFLVFWLAGPSSDEDRMSPITLTFARPITEGVVYVPAESAAAQNRRSNTATLSVVVRDDPSIIEIRTCSGVSCPSMVAPPCR